MRLAEAQSGEGRVIAEPRGMYESDWADCRASISEHLEMYHRAPSEWVLWTGTGLIGYGSYSSGRHSWILWAGIAMQAIYWLKSAKLVIAKKALFDGYEMGFEAAEIRALGYTVDEYPEMIRRGADRRA